MKKFNSTIIHISDPHYGTEDKSIADELINEINTRKPDLVIVSGDLTQRAFDKQFKKADRLLKSINSPKVVIPGNHDIPLFNLFQRFYRPFKKYQKFISEDIYPEFISDEMAIVGVNSCTPFRSQTGRIKDYDIDYLKNFFAKIDPIKVRGVVVHHNIFPFEGMKKNTSLVNADTFLSAMSKCGVDLIFAGHLHKSLAHTYTEAGTDNNLVVLQAGTCISRRLREEDNTYLVIHRKDDEFNVEFRVYNGTKFELANEKKYEKFSSMVCE